MFRKFLRVFAYSSQTEKKSNLSELRKAALTAKGVGTSSCSLSKSF